MCCARICMPITSVGTHDLSAADGSRPSRTPATCSPAGNGSTGARLNCEPHTPPIRTMRIACYRSWTVARAEFVATDYAFDDSVWIEPWPGHTPGHVCVVVRSQRASVVLSGDIMHTALQCAEPQLNSCFCVDTETARATRRRFLETFADGPVMVIPAHFPTPTAGWIRSHERSFRYHFDRLR